MEFLSWPTDEAYDSLAEAHSGETATCAVPTWVIWEKQAVQTGGTEGYAKATRKIATIGNASEFWRVFLALPQPSELLEGGRIVREAENGATQHIDTLMIFREGVKPEWEDPKNKHGGHFQYQFRPGSVVGPPLQVDEYWNNLILGVFGGSIEGSEKITGIRLVDKMGSSGRSSCIRIEVWFQTYNDRSVSSLQTAVDNCMATKLDGTLGVCPKCEVKSHSE